MSRVKRGSKRLQKRKRVLKQAKGYYGTKSRSYRIAKLAVDKSLEYSYRYRRNRKRDMRRLWIVRINAAARLNGISYNKFINGLSKAGCVIDRKILADLAVADAAAFTRLADMAREAQGMEAQGETVAHGTPEDRLAEIAKEAKVKAKEAKGKTEEPAAKDDEAEPEAADSEAPAEA